jgi:hypothetical protein
MVLHVQNINFADGTMNSSDIIIMTGAFVNPFSTSFPFRFEVSVSSRDRQYHQLEQPGVPLIKLAISDCFFPVVAVRNSGFTL